MREESLLSKDRIDDKERRELMTVRCRIV